MISSQFRSPFCVYKAVKEITQRRAVISYLFKKKEFLEMVDDIFKMDPQEEGKKLYKLFKVKNPQGHKVVNVLEVLSVVVLLANFGQSNERDLLHNSELIEHKINLMLIMFDMRDECSINVVEVMLLARTALQGFSKVFPNVRFFSNEAVVEEIRPAILELFTAKVEAQVKREQE